MRNLTWTIACAIVLSSFANAAEVASASDESADTSANRTLKLAQAKGEIELSAETVGDENIFESLQIQLLDLETLGQEVRERLIGEQINMTLAECIQMALQANQDILVVGFDPLISSANLESSKGEFDPTLSALYSFRDSSSPTSGFQSFLPGVGSAIGQKAGDYQLSLGGKLFWGTEYSIDTSMNKTTGTFTADQDYNSGVTLTVTQPILRNWGKNANLARVRSARNSFTMSEYDFESTVLRSVGDVITAYWDLVGLIELVIVRQESFDNAMRLVNINQQRFNIGTAAAIEVLQAKAGAALRQSDLITARTAVLDAEDMLKNLIGLYDEDLFSSRSVVPIDRPNLSEVDWDMERSMRTALDNRPEIHSAELQLENARIELKRTRNALKPQLDASTSYGHAGLDSDFRDSYEDTIEKDGRTWTISLTGSIPIGNRAARGTHKSAKLFVRQAEQRLIQSKQQAMLGVRISLRGVISNEILIESSKQARILQEANVAAEEKRLSLGVTTSQDVLDIQEDLLEAQTQEIQAMVNFEKSLADLQVAEGMLLENMGITYESPADEESLSFLQSLRTSDGGR